MTDQQIDFELALAIGYAPDRVRIQKFWYKGDYRHLVQVLNDYSRMDGPMQYGAWQRFDHKDPAVIWPIAERFDAFPKQGESLKDFWFVGEAGLNEKWSLCAATASALAVIEHCKKDKP